jgi:hypothetical protein
MLELLNSVNISYAEFLDMRDKRTTEWGDHLELTKYHSFVHSNDNQPAVVRKNNENTNSYVVTEHTATHINTGVNTANDRNDVNNAVMPKTNEASVDQQLINQVNQSLDRPIYPMKDKDGRIDDIEQAQLKLWADQKIKKTIEKIRK